MRPEQAEQRTDQQDAENRCYKSRQDGRAGGPLEPGQGFLSPTLGHLPGKQDAPADPEPVHDHVENLADGHGQGDGRQTDIADAVAQHQPVGHVAQGKHDGGDQRREILAPEHPPDKILIR